MAHADRSERVMTRILVTGAGGFIGHHLVSALKRQGHWVRGVDIKQPEYAHRRRPTSSCCSICASRPTRGRRPTAPSTPTPSPPTWAAWAASLRITRCILHNNSLINLNTLEAARVSRRRALPLLVVGMRLPRAPADRRGGHRVEGRRRLPGAAAGRLRLGEAHHRAAVHALPRGLRHRDADRPLPQHLRPVTARGTADARRRRRRCAARWPPPS